MKGDVIDSLKQQTGVFDAIKEEEKRIKPPSILPYTISIMEKLSKQADEARAEMQAIVNAVSAKCPVYAIDTYCAGCDSEFQILLDNKTDTTFSLARILTDEGCEISGGQWICPACVEKKELEENGGGNPKNDAEAGVSWKDFAGDAACSGWEKL